MKKILMICSRIPYPLSQGFNIRVYGIANILSQKYQVDLLIIDERKVADEHLKELKSTFDKVTTYHFNPILFKLNTLKGLASRDPLQTYYFYFREVQRWINNNYYNYDLIFCCYIRVARYLKNINKPKVIDLIDATSINYQEAQERTKGLWRLIYSIENRRLLSYELKMLKEFDRAFLASPFDKAYLDKKSVLSNDNLIVIPNGVNEELFSQVNRFEVKEENWVVFTGKMDYNPNIDAATYFAKNVFPLIRKKHKTLKFIIVGTSPAKQVLTLKDIEGIEVTGYVDDLYEYVKKAKLIVAPLRFSAGIQNKILEAMALKRAVVTTSKGARGINGENGKHFIVADERKEMVSRILNLLDDEPQRKEIGKNARKLIENKYRWDIVGRELLKNIEDLI